MRTGLVLVSELTLVDPSGPSADPDHPESALNAIPKAVLQRARGESF